LESKLVRYQSGYTERWSSLYRDAARAAVPVISPEQDRPQRCPGIADMMRLGHHRPVHVKSKASQLLRTALIARKKFVEHMLSVETTIRGLLKVNGLKLGNVNRCGLPQKLRLCSMMHRSCDWLLLRCSKRGT
jgi:hypothetical protein